MPIAALPGYLVGQDLSQASPGLRFGMYLPIWTTRQDQEAEVKKRAEARSREGDEVRNLLSQGMEAAIRQLRQRPQRPLPGLWDKNDFAARNAWNNIKKLTKEDHARMKALAERQSALAETAPVDGLLRLDALASAPFTTGLGNEHPLENGFAFLNPYGLPYLPGSGVKGVLRQAARELASGEWGDTRGWSEEQRYPLLVNSKTVLDSSKQPVMLSMLDLLFGRETPSGESGHLRGTSIFWDVIPQIEGDSLMVEIMTPHQSHYYQQRAHAGSTSPHNSGPPNPISFLTVPPGSSFAFYVQCDLAQLRRLAPELASEGRWRTLVTAAFKHAFEWLGFGAKTAVGYGAMQRDAQAERHAQQIREQREAEERAAVESQRKAAEREAELAKMTPIERAIREFLDQRSDKNQTEISAVVAAIKQGRWQGEDKIAVTQWLEKVMRATKGQWKEVSQAKKPEKDREHQNTLLVRGWLQGK